MQLISALGGASLIQQMADFARGLVAEGRRLGAWIVRRLETLVGQLRTLDMQLPPVRVFHALDTRLGELRARPREAVAEKMIEERQWGLATRELHSSAGSAERAAWLHDTAAMQIDAAVYALDGLFDDLRGVMNLGYRDNVFALRADYNAQHAEPLYAGAVRTVVSEVRAPRHLAEQRRAA